MQEFHKALKHQMKEKNVKLKDVASYVGVSVSTVAYWLSGRNKPILPHMKSLCKLFEVDMIDLLYMPEALPEVRLAFLLKKYNLDTKDFENYEQIEKMISDYFIDNIGKFRRKKD